MKHGIIISLFTLLPLFAFAQDRQVRPTVSGKIVDRHTDKSVGWASMWSYEEGKPRVLKVSYAKPDGSIAWQAPRAGSYKLIFRADGYIADSLVVTFAADTTLGTIELYPDPATPSRQLDEAVVTADRPLLAHLVDRYVYDVSRDPEAKRKKMTEIIEKIPGLKGNTPTGQLEYNGEGFQQILIDGEQHEMINSRLQFPMRMIRGDVMNKIEIIPPGSPQYNNDRPILNIITARALPNGYAFEVSGDGNTEHTYNGKLDFISKIRDAAIVSFGYTPSYADRPKLHHYSIRELFNASGLIGVQQSEGVSDGYAHSHNFRFGTSFKILGNTLSLRANTSLGESGSNSEMATVFFDGVGVQQSHQTTKSQNTTKIFPRLGLETYYNITLPKNNKLSLSYTFSDGYSEGDYSTLTRHTPSAEQGGRHSGSATGAQEHTARVLFIPQIGRMPKHSIMGSLQFGLRKYDNLSEYYLWDGVAGVNTLDFDWINGLSYTQRIANGNVQYMFLTQKLSASFTLSGGYESDHGTFQDPLPSSIHYSYVQLNPRSTVLWRVSRNVGINFSYVNSAIRPGVEKLNPYLDDSDPFNLCTGNPTLRPENAHVFGTGPSITLLKTKILVTPLISYTIINYAIEQITVMTENKVGLTSYANLGRRTGLDVRIPVSLRMKTTTFMAILYYQNINYKSSDSDVGTNILQNLRLELNMKASPYKGSHISCSYMFGPKNIAAQSTKLNYYHDFSFYWQQTILKNKFFATLSLDNPFESHRYLRNTISGPGFTYTDRREQLGRIWIFSLRANFGRFRERIAEQNEIFRDRERPQLITGSNTTPVR